MVGVGMVGVGMVGVGRVGNRPTLAMDSKSGAIRLGDLLRT